MRIEQWVGIVSAGTALTAVIVGPLVTWRITKRQIEAATISANRQAWINTLRDAVAEFLTEVNLTSAVDHSGAGGNHGLVALKQIMHLNHKIELLINPNEADHTKLNNLIGDATNALTGVLGPDANTPTAWDARNRAITTTCQAILKREWERVKSGEPR